MASPVPVRFSDDATLRLDEGGNWAFAVLILRAPANASQRDDAIVNNYADLRIWVRLAGQHYSHIIRPS